MVETQGTTAQPPLRFRVLGPLQAERGDAVLPLGRLQQRVVLALLLLHVGRPYPRDQLIDAIWGDSAPTYAVNLLQKHVSLLRQGLEPDRSAHPTRPGLLGWTDAGYVLTVPPSAVDLHEFQRETERARSARRAGELETASDTLHRALTRWRGSLCDGLHSPLLDAERARLDEVRIGVLEDRAEIDLALGRDVDQVPELRRLVTEYPLRERLRASLMIALHRAGRTGEALAVYRETRRHLRDELGLDPSPELQRVQERILGGDPGLLSASATTTVRHHPEPADEAVVPAQLPHRISDFTGRVDQFRLLDRLLDEQGESGPVIAAIAGGAGVGKTALAIAWAHDVKHRFPDGQLYVNLRGFDPAAAPMEPGAAVRGFLDALGVGSHRLPVTVEGQCALLRSVLAGRRMLLVLDNARDSDQVRPLLPGAAGCPVVVTSRHDLTGLIATDGALPIALGLLSRVEARQYLSRRLGSARLDREAAAADEIVRRCACLPLALAIVAARAASRPDFALDALVAELGELDDGLDAFDGGDASSDMRRVFSWSQTGLSDGAALMFRLLGLHPGPQISVAAASALVARPVAQARKVLAELARAHLVEEAAPGRFAFHDLLRAYAAELVEETEDRVDRDAARGRLLDFYSQTAQRADRLLLPMRYPELWLTTPPVVDPAPLADATAARDWFRVEHPILLAMAERARLERLDVVAYQLCWAMATYLDHEYHWHDLEKIQRTAREAGRSLDDPRAEAHAERGLGRARTWQRRFGEANDHFDRALELFASNEDLVGIALTHYTLSWMRGLQGRFEAALVHAEAALDIFRAVGPREALAETLNEVGWFKAQLGDADGALPFCEEALALHQQIGHPEGEAQTWDSLGFIHRARGELDEAAECYREAVARWVDMSDRYYEAAALVGLGDVFLAAGRLSDVRLVWSRARMLFEELSDPSAADVQGRLAELPAPDDDRGRAAQVLVGGGIGPVTP